MSETSANRAPRPPAIEPDAPLIGDWLHIEADGTVVVFTGKVEVGQHIRTSLAQAVAEELRLPLDKLRLVMADTDRTPYDMGTVGSRTTPIMARRLLSGIKYALPVARPGKIVCLGLNYLDHVKEGPQRDNIPMFPSIFLRCQTSLTPHEAPIVGNHRLDVQ